MNRLPGWLSRRTKPRPSGPRLSLDTCEDRTTPAPVGNFLLSSSYFRHRAAVVVTPPALAPHTPTAPIATPTTGVIAPRTPAVTPTTPATTPALPVTRPGAGTPNAPGVITPAPVTPGPVTTTPVAPAPVTTTPVATTPGSTVPGAP